MVSGTHAREADRIRSRSRVLVLVNPLASERHPGLAIALATAASELDLLMPRGVDAGLQFRAAAEMVETGVDAVVVCGGDGTVAAGLALTAGTGIPLGIVPAGTGNDFARAAHIERSDPAGSLARLLDGLRDGALRTCTVDALRMSVVTRESGASNVWVANSANIGFDALVNARANTYRHLPVTGRYLVALLRELPAFRPARFRISRDDQPPRDRTATLICVQNGPWIGGGIPLAPSADPRSGTAVLSTVDRIPRLVLAALFPLIYLRAHRLLTPLCQHRIERARITVPSGVPVYADGEEILPGSQDGAEVEIAVVPGAVRLIQGLPDRQPPCGASWRNE